MTELACTCILNTKYVYLDVFSFYTRTPWIQEVKKVLINVGLVLHICHWNEWIRVTSNKYPKLTSAQRFIENDPVLVPTLVLIIILVAILPSNLNTKCPYVCMTSLVYLDM
jgi:hypothetical protein